MRSEFEDWFDQYENNNEYAAKQIAKDAYELGLQHRQTEVDELQKRVEELIQELSERGDKAWAVWESSAEMYEQGRADAFWQAAAMLEQALKGDSTINSTMGESGECLHFSTTLFNDGEAECFHCDAVVNEKREVIGKQSKGLHPFFKKESK